MSKTKQTTRFSRRRFLGNETANKLISKVYREGWDFKLNKA